METAIPTVFGKFLEEIKALSSRPLHNIFLNGNELKDIMTQKRCLLERCSNTCFLLVPRHGAFHDVLFCSAGPNDLHFAIGNLLSKPANWQHLRVSAIGYDLEAGCLAQIFRDRGFGNTKKIARMRNKPQDKERLEQIRDLRSADRQANVEYARPGDEPAILELLKSEFDLRNDNLPEYNEIVRNVALNQVIVVRVQDRIAALHYFTRNGKFTYGWYDVTLPEYRKENFYFDIMHFQIEQAQDLPVPMRSYSWRDVANKRLMRLAESCNQVRDGVYIYNLTYDAPEFKGQKERCNG